MARTSTRGGQATSIIYKLDFHNRIPFPLSLNTIMKSFVGMMEIQVMQVQADCHYDGTSPHP